MRGSDSLEEYHECLGKPMALGGTLWRRYGVVTILKRIMSVWRNQWRREGNCETIRGGDDLEKSHECLGGEYITGERQGDRASRTQPERGQYLGRLQWTLGRRKIVPDGETKAVRTQEPNAT
jgi:hypothetical protein